MQGNIGNHKATALVDRSAPHQLLSSVFIFLALSNSKQVRRTLGLNVVGGQETGWGQNFHSPGVTGDRNRTDRLDRTGSIQLSYATIAE